MSEIEKPILPPTIPEIRCSMCQSSPKILSTSTARMGFEHWTLRCTSCGHIDQVQVNVGAAETVVSPSRSPCRATGTLGRRAPLSVTRPSATRAAIMRGYLNLEPLAWTYLQRQFL
jgi:hypothetical protein